MSENTQLTSAIGYDTKRMIFSTPLSGSIPNTPINYKRILISTKNEDGTVGDLILPTEQLFSFGVSENVNPDTKKVNGYVMPLCLYNRDGPSKNEKAWVETFNNIVERCKDHIIENREEIEMYDLTRPELKKLNILYYKREKGKIVEGTGPTLYAKLIVSKKQNKIITMFFDYDGEPIDPLNLLGKYCFTKSAVKIESIFIGNKISLQVKLYECEVKLMETGMKRLLRRPAARQRVLTADTKSVNPMNDTKDDSDDDDEGSINGSDDEEEGKKVVVKAAPKKIIRRKVKKVVRKAA